MCVDPNRVDTICSHKSEVMVDLLSIVILASFLIRPKGAVTNTFDIEFFRADVEKLATDPRPLRSCGNRCWRLELARVARRESACVRYAVFRS